MKTDKMWYMVNNLYSNKKYRIAKKVCVFGVGWKLADYTRNTLGYGPVKCVAINGAAGAGVGLAMDLGAIGAMAAIDKVKEVKVKKSEKKEAKNIKKVEELEKEPEVFIDFRGL